MRTTLDLDDAVLQAARSAAREMRTSIGAVISEWARRGINTPVPSTKKRSRLPTFSVSSDCPPVNAGVVKELIDDEGLPP